MITEMFSVILAIQTAQAPERVNNIEWKTGCIDVSNAVHIENSLKFSDDIDRIKLHFKKNPYKNDREGLQLISIHQSKFGNMLFRFSIYDSSNPTIVYVLDGKNNIVRRFLHDGWRTKHDVSADWDCTSWQR